MSESVNVPQENAVDRLSDEIKETERNGSITGIGVVLGFSLTFLIEWSIMDDAWQSLDLIPLILLCIGVIFQVSALYQVLSSVSHRTLKLEEHSRLIKRFILGVSIVLLGFATWAVISLSIELNDPNAVHNVAWVLG